MGKGAHICIFNVHVTSQYWEGICPAFDCVFQKLYALANPQHSAVTGVFGLVWDGHVLVTAATIPIPLSSISATAKRHYYPTKMLRCTAAQLD